MSSSFSGIDQAKALFEEIATVTPDNVTEMGPKLQLLDGIAKQIQYENHFRSLPSDLLRFFRAPEAKIWFGYDPAFCDKYVTPCIYTYHRMHPDAISIIIEYANVMYGIVELVKRFSIDIRRDDYGESITDLNSDDYVELFTLGLPIYKNGSQTPFYREPELDYSQAVKTYFGSSAEEVVETYQKQNSGGYLFAEEVSHSEY